MTDDELRALFEAIRQENAATREDVAATREDIAVIRQENAATREDVAAIRQENAATREDVAAIRQENAATREDVAAIRQENAVTREDVGAIRQENAAAHLETRRHFDVAVERLEKRFDTLAESVQYLDEKVDRKTADLEERMEHGFTETQAMIKFSHAELDRRMCTLEGTQRSLEDVVADLQARVVRLESSTH